MQTAKLFASGRSQAVRLPKAYRFEGKEVIIKQMGEGVLLLPIKSPWLIMQEALAEFEPDFHIVRESQGEQKREQLL